MSGGKFLMEWQVKDKITEWIFFQFTFNLLQMSQTQEIINHRVSKIHEWIWGNVYEWGNVFSAMTNDRKSYWVNFCPTFTNKLNSRNNNSYGFEILQMDIGGCVWVGESFLRNDKWQIKLLSQFYPNLHSTIQMTQTQEIINHRVLKIQEWIWENVYDRGKFSYGMTSKR